MSVAAGAAIPVALGEVYVATMHFRFIFMPVIREDTMARMPVF